MFKAGYGGSLTDVIEQESFATAEDARTWLVGKLEIMASREYEMGINTFKGFAASCLRGHSLPIIWRGPDQVTYYVLPED